MKAQSSRLASGVCYAEDEDGRLLPVVDVTHPAFRVDLTHGDLGAIAERTHRAFERSARLPGFIVRLLARRSAIMRGTMAAAGGYLSAMTTYLYKVGADNLRATGASRLDCQMAAGLMPVCCRIRLQVIAEQMAAVVTARGRSGTGRLVFVNLAGGTAIDSINALLVLRKQAPELLEGLDVSIRLLDVDEAAASFGARLLTALAVPAGPLAGLHVRLSYTSYDWRHEGNLAASLGALDPCSVVIGSSEGGLFEYGSDAEILLNLEVLRACTPRDFVIVGSLFHSDQVPWVLGPGRPSVRSRGPEDFAALVARCGWRARVVGNPNVVYHVVELSKAA